MKHGVFIFATDQSIDVSRLAREAEQRGFESFWVPEHAHIPDQLDTRFPLSEDGELPEMYRRIHDPFIALAFAAAATTTLKLGTGITLISQREPIVMAKTVASLDRLSGGRVLLGIGAGWLREEMEPLGTRFEDRWKVTTERIAAMRSAWTEELASFDGDFVSFPPTRVIPKPVQEKGPPILIGAGSKWARQRAVDWGDAWMPNIPKTDFIERGMQDLARRARESGRPVPPTTVFGAAANDCDFFADLGVERVIHVLSSAGADVVLPELDALAPLVTSS